MALVNAVLNLKLDRTNGTFEVLDTSTRIYTRDAKVSLNVIGWTVEEVTKTSEKTPYEPYFKITNRDGVTLSEVKLSPDATPTPETDGTYAMRGELSTDTDKMVAETTAFGSVSGCQYDFDASIYSTTEANPIATGVVYIWPFVGNGDAPSNLPAASEVLAQLQAQISAHIAAITNPHAVTAEQVGSYTKGQVDANFVGLTAFNNLSQLVASANNAIAALQSALTVVNTTLSSHAIALTGKADVVSTYRKDETYNRMQIEKLIVDNGAQYLLAGKVLKEPTSDRERNEMLTFIINSLGGNIDAAGAVPQTPPTAIAIKAQDGTTRSIRALKDSTGNYTTEVA